MNETYELKDRTYIEPTVSRDEQLNFVNNLRATQQADLSKINRDTHALGTNVTSNLGGLGGAEGVFNRRYVAPQTNSLVSELKSKAQATALNTALNNLQAQYQNEYNQAYRSYNKRNRTSGNNNGNDDDPYAGLLDGILNSYKFLTTQNVNDSANKNNGESGSNSNSNSGTNSDSGSSFNLPLKNPFSINKRESTPSSNSGSNSQPSAWDNMLNILKFF